MKRFLSLLIFAQVFLGLPMSGWASQSRIAIIDTSAQGELESLLVTELSKANGIELVERTEIDKVLKEHALSASDNLNAQLSIASILHADGLLILDKVKLNEGDVLSVRLTASGPGVVIGSAIFALRKDDPASLAKDILTRFDPLWQKLRVKREQALPISLLNLRCSVKSATAEKLENQLTFLFANRLIAQPELFVLERWRLGDVAFEKAFEHVDEGAFWNGCYIVDGEIQTSGATSPRKVSVKVFARSPGSKEVKTIEATGEDGKLPELATELAGQLAKLFAKQPAAGAWDTLEESREYLREADWAYRNKLFRVARSALEASGALGNRDPKWFKLGAKIYSDMAYSSVRLISVFFGAYSIRYDKNVDVSQEPERIRCAQLALNSLRELLKTPREPKPEDKTIPYWEVANDRRGHIGNITLLAASLVLRSAYEHGFRTDPALAEIRASIRELYPILVAWREREDKWPGEHPETVATDYYPYWFETPAEQLACCHDLLRFQPIRNVASELIAMRNHLMRTSKTSEKVDEMPRLLSWKGIPEEELESQWNQFVASLLASENKLERIDGMLLEIADAKSDKETLAGKILEACWEARDELVAANRLEAVVGNLDQYFAKPRSNTSYNIIDHAVRMKWLLYFLDHSNQEDFAFLRRLWLPNSFEEADAAYKAFRGYRERLLKAGMEIRFLEEPERDLLKRFPELHPSLPDGGLHITEFHPLPDLLTNKISKPVVHMVRCADKIWICVTSSGNKDYHGGIYGLNINDFTVTETIAFPDTMKDYSSDQAHFFASDAAFYYWLGGSCQRYDRKTQKWSTINFPGKGWTSLLPSGEDLFIVSSSNNNADRSSGIWKWVAATGEFQMISNNRRRPAQNLLDDRQGYIDSRLFSGPEGRLGARVNFFGFLFDASTAKCELVKGTENCSFETIPCDDSTVILSENGSAGLINNRSGKDVEWLKNELPVNTPENGGLMLVPFKYWVKHGTTKAEVTVGYCNGKLWYCLPRDASPTQFHLLRCLDWSRPDQPAPPVSVAFELPEEMKATLKTSSPSTGEIPDVMNLIATEKGVILWSYSIPGFWFISTEEVEKAQRQLAASTPKIGD